MRVNPNLMPDLLAALGQTKLEEQQDELELATGSSVNVPSDNPVAAALLVENNDQATFNASYLQSLATVNGQLSTADSTLNSVVTTLQRAISLGVEGANGTLSDSDRNDIAQELQGIQSQLISLANTSYEGNYIFGGTETATPPYTANPSDPSGSGVTYNGNTDVNEVSVGSGYQVAVNVPGSQLFSESGNDVFLALNNLISAIQSNGDIADATNALSSAANYLTAQRVFYGNAMSQVQSQTTYLDTAKQQIAQQQNTLGAADMATAATGLSAAQTDEQAAIEAMSKVSQNTLFDYLR
ncbi:MAG TPA: flagellar hook-associated protein FlgL [Terriglobales bacterium]|nr:flagellar hook-associated protein FlgL [Terriglobales bacterium]